MAFGRIGSSKRNSGSLLERSNSRSGISHSSIHESKHGKNFHSSIHDHNKIHESMHLGKDRITNPFNRKRGK